MFVGIELFIVFLYGPSGLPGGTVVKNPPDYAGDMGDVGLVPGSKTSPRVGNGNPLLYSCLGTPMDRVQSTGSQKSQTRLSD